MKKSGILFSMIAIMILAGGYAVRDMWLPGLVGEDVAKLSPTEFMADLLSANPNTEENKDVPAPEVLPPENDTAEDVPDLPLEETPPPVDIPEDRIELIEPTKTSNEPEITLDELIKENGEQGTLPSSGPGNRPRPSEKN